MSKLSRREFFTQCTHRLTDQVDGPAVRNLVGKFSKSESPVSKPQWVAAGSFAVASPGTCTEFNVGGRSFMLTSIPEGVFVQSTDGIYLALRSSARGIIEVNLGLEWPKGRMLSHSTGEPVDLNAKLTVGEKI